MAVSVFDLFKIGIGPSSSHTVGPMRAANLFVQQIKSHDLTDRTDSIFTELYGSLSHTGRGHGTDKAIILGLLGKEPDKIDPDEIPALLEKTRQAKKICIDDLTIRFDDKKHLKFHKRKTLPLHSNGMQFTALDDQGNELLRKAYYSVGGGFILSHSHLAKKHIIEDDTKIPYPAGEYECRILGADPAQPPTLYKHGNGPNSGFLGRTGIYELIAVDDAMRTMIHDGVSEQELERHARTKTPSIRADGRRQVLEGHTTLEEVLRVTRED